MSVLWREGNIRAVCWELGLSIFWWVALARRQFTGRGRWRELSRSVMVARLGEKEAFGSRVLA